MTKNKIKIFSLILFLIPIFCLGQPKIKIDSLDLHLGEVLLSNRMNFEIKVYNIGNEKLIIQKILGNTMSDWPKDGIKKGKSAQIQIALPNVPGLFRKTYQIYSNSEPDSILMIKIEGCMVYNYGDKENWEKERKEIELKIQQTNDVELRKQDSSQAAYKKYLESIVIVKIDSLNPLFNFFDTSKLDVKIVSSTYSEYYEIDLGDLGRWKSGKDYFVDLPIQNNSINDIIVATWWTKDSVYWSKPIKPDQKSTIRCQLYENAVGLGGQATRIRFANKPDDQLIFHIRAKIIYEIEATGIIGENYHYFDTRFFLKTSGNKYYAIGGELRDEFDSYIGKKVRISGTTYKTVEGNIDGINVEKITEIK